jgi:DNA-binding NarL/FixJ family response regulator
VHAGDALLAPSVTRRLIATFLESHRPANVDRSALAALTPRELDVLRLIAAGRSNTEIAADLVLSQATVKTHVGRIFSKVGARDRAQAVVYAYECGVVSPSGR